MITTNTQYLQSKTNSQVASNAWYMSACTREPNIKTYTEEPAIKPARSVEESIKRTHNFLRAHQYEDGYWWGELESNNSMEAEYIMLLHIMGVEKPPGRLEKIVNLLEKTQLPTGGWAMYYGGQADLSTSVEVYTAMKIAGVPHDSKSMCLARDLILKKGGVEKARVFTKIWLAMLGQWDWKGVPYLAPELILIPSNLPLNIYSFASWTRATIVPITIILSQKPTWKLPQQQSIDELYINGKQKADYSLKSPPWIGWERLLYSADAILRRMDKLLSLSPIRTIALAQVEKWILQHQERDGSWGGIQPPWVYSLIAIKALGYSIDHPAICKGLQGFESFAIEDDKTWRIQACISPVWDTCLTLNALIESGVDVAEPFMLKATDWLISKQITRQGDWSVRIPKLEPGGWAFEFENDMYPDIDDAAEILFALARSRSSDEDRKHKAIQRGLTWLLGMQSNNGGWGAFDKDNTSRIAVKLPFFDFGEVIDPPSVDVTAHVLEALAECAKLNDPTIQKQVSSAVKYILREQEKDSPWFGRWGINYIYGTGAVLPALQAIGYDMTDPKIQSAADWIESKQNHDGGWGETPASYAVPDLRGHGVSCASQTAWALISLIACGRSNSKSARLGIQYLLNTQAEDGTWSELEYTAAGFPGYGIGERIFKSPNTSTNNTLPKELPSGFMIKYHMYRIYWPLLALGRWQKEQHNQNKHYKTEG